MKEKFKQGEIPLPDFWGGYRVVPSVRIFGRAAPIAYTTALNISVLVRAINKRMCPRPGR